jgi:hypothetical protein
VVDRELVDVIHAELFKLGEGPKTRASGPSPFQGHLSDSPCGRSRAS